MNLPPAGPDAPEARSILMLVQARLRDAGIDSAALDARLLLGMAIGRDDAVLPHETLVGWTAGHGGALDAMIERRLAGEPVSRIRGWREFWSLRLALSPDTLDPRPIRNNRHRRPGMGEATWRAAASARSWQRVGRVASGLPVGTAACQRDRD